MASTPERVDYTVTVGREGVEVRPPLCELAAGGLANALGSIYEGEGYVTRQDEFGTAIAVRPGTRTPPGNSKLDYMGDIGGRVSELINPAGALNVVVNNPRSGR